MPKLTFAARVIYGAGEAKPKAPKRVLNPKHKVVVRNPWTGHAMWLRPTHITNIVDGVASVQIVAAKSNRWGLASTKGLEYLNPLTGNTFKVGPKAIIKETE